MFRQDALAVGEQWLSSGSLGLRSADGSVRRPAVPALISGPPDAPRRRRAPAAPATPRVGRAVACGVAWGGVGKLNIERPMRHRTLACGSQVSSVRSPLCVLGRVRMPAIAYRGRRGASARRGPRPAPPGPEYERRATPLRNAPAPLHTTPSYCAQMLLRRTV